MPRLPNTMSHASSLGRIIKCGRALCAIDYGISTCCAVQVEDGYVLIDTGESVSAAQQIKAAFKDHLDGKLHSIIYTHSHGDHVYGSSVFAEAGTPIWAHQQFYEEVRQQQQLGLAHYHRGSKQFGYALSPDQAQPTGIGPLLRLDAGPLPPIRFPTATFVDEVKLEWGGTRFVLRHCPGESHDQISVWLPDDCILFAADNIYKAFPNLYAIRGVAPRPILGWIESLDYMRRLEPRPETLILGHTEPIAGADAIHQLLTDYRDAIQFVHDSVVRGVNAGLEPDELVRTIRLPPHLESHPYLQQTYGTLRGAIRGIYSGYVGWFDGRDQNLDPLSTAEIAARLIPQLGGEEALSRRVVEASKQLGASGDARWQLWLCDLLLSRRDSRRLREAKADLLRALASASDNPPTRNWLLTDAALLMGEIRTPRRIPANADSVEDVPVEMLIGHLPHRLDPQRSRKLDMTVAFEMTDTERGFTFTIRKGVGEVAPFIKGTPDLLVQATERDFRRVLVAAETKPYDLRFWQRVKFSAPGVPGIAQFRMLRRLGALNRALSRL